MGHTVQTGRSGERDFPVGHPAASDYNGEEYAPPRSPHGEDFPTDHPARLGKNIPAEQTAELARFNGEQKETE